MTFGIYVVFPIILFIIAINLFKINIPPIIQPVIGILYTVWVVIGLLSFVNILGPEAMDFLKEIIKSFIRKK